MQNSTYLHATSDLEKQHLIELGITTPIRVIPHGIKISELVERETNKKRKKALLFSRIHEKKGLLELVESWKEVNNTDWTLEIYGPISDQKYLQSVIATIKKYNLEDCIKIYKPYFDKKKKEEILKSADCFLLPSKSENFGMSIIEALSYGLPVLTTTETPWKKLGEINAGIIFEFSQNNLTNNLRKILNMTSDELLIMGKIGRNFIKKHYDLEKVIHQYVDFYKEVFEK